MSSYSSHFRPTSAKQEAMRRWSPTQRRKAMITALRNLPAPEVKAITMPRFVGNPRYWREQGAMARKGICLNCKGEREVAVTDIYGEYDGTEPCWVCQRTNTSGRIPLDDIPF